MKDQEQQEPKAYLSPKGEPGKATRQKAERFYKAMEDQVEKTPGAKGARGRDV